MPSLCIHALCPAAPCELLQPGGYELADDLHQATVRVDARVPLLSVTPSEHLDTVVRVVGQLVSSRAIGQEDGGTLPGVLVFPESNLPRNQARKLVSYSHSLRLGASRGCHPVAPSSQRCRLTLVTSPEASSWSVRVRRRRRYMARVALISRMASACMMQEGSGMGSGAAAGRTQ